MAKRSFTVKKIVLLTGVFLLCGMILTSVDDCEENYFDQYELPDFENDSEKAVRSPGTGQQGLRQSQRQPEGQGQSGTRQSAEQTSQQARQPAGQQSGQSARQSSGSQSGQGAQQSGTAQSGSQAARPAGTQASAGGTPQAAVSSIGGKEWKLMELRKGTAVTVIDRRKLESDGFGDLFTVNFGERVTGKAAPNRFTAPYQAGASNALTIQPPAATLMASIYDPERIREKDYFQYLVNVKSWKLARGRLELYSSDSSGKETVLVYGN